jgi:transcriptional regulator with XRE-family HTH domain
MPKEEINIKDLPAVKARKKKGLTLQEMSDEIGIQPNRISTTERGSNTPKKETARAMYEFFGGEVPLGAIYDPHYFVENNLDK